MRRHIILFAILSITMLASIVLLPVLNNRVIGTNLIPPILLIILLLGESRYAYAGGIISGFIADLLLPFPFGTFLVSYTLPLLITRWISQRWITNRSLFAFVGLMIAGSTLVSFTGFLFNAVWGVFSQESTLIAFHEEWWVTLASTLIRNTGIAMLIYAGIRLSGKSYARLSEKAF